MILRWDPVPDSINDGGRGIDHTATVFQGAEPQNPPESDFRIKKGDTLFGFRCMDVYTEADWYRAELRPFSRGYQE